MREESRNSHRHIIMDIHTLGSFLLKQLEQCNARQIPRIVKKYEFKNINSVSKPATQIAANMITCCLPQFFFDYSYLIQATEGHVCYVETYISSGTHREVSSGFLFNVPIQLSYENILNNVKHIKHM